MPLKHHFSLMLAALSLLNGCAAPTQHVQGSYQTPNKRLEGTVIGAAGAAIGGSALLSTGDMIASAAAGAPLGAIFSGSKTKSTLMDRLQKEGITVVAQGDKLRLVLPSEQFFELNEPELKKSQYLTLNYVGALLKEYGYASISIRGYTDDMGSREYQEKISLERARSILSYLWVHGIEFEHMSAEGLGSKNAIADNHTVHGKTLNRRVEITLREGCELDS